MLYKTAYNFGQSDQNSVNYSSNFHIKRTKLRNVNWHSHYGKQYGGSLKKLRIDGTSLNFSSGSHPHAFTVREMSSIPGQETRIPHAIQCDQNIEQQSKKLRIKLPYNPAILLLGIYPYKTTIQKDICASMLTAALFTIAKTWKQTECPMTDEQIKKM